LSGPHEVEVAAAQRVIDPHFVVAELNREGVEGSQFLGAQ
jgi:hypothetical protein